MKKQQPVAVQLCLSVDKSISSLLQDMKHSRQPLVIEAVNKIEEARNLLEYLQQAEVIKSTTVRVAIHELLAKF